MTSMKRKLSSSSGKGVSSPRRKTTPTTSFRPLDSARAAPSGTNPSSRTAWRTRSRVACETPSSRAAPKPATPQSIILQPGDLPGMHRCDTSGEVTAVLNLEKIRKSPAYDMNATEWEQWKRQGAIAASFAVYGRTAADCAAASGSTTGAPQGGLVVGLVVQFRDTNGAALNYRRDSTLMGLGPRA